MVSLGVGPSCLRVDSEETLPALLNERGEMSFTVPGVTPDGGPMEGASVLEPIEHSLLEKPLDGGPKQWMPVLEPLEHSESCAEERTYIRPTLLAGSPVCARTVTGSLLFGSPLRHVRSCFRSAVLFLLQTDGLDGIRNNTDVQHDRLLATVVSRFTPDIFLSAWIVLRSTPSCGGACDIAHWKRLGQYLIPPGNFVWFVLNVCYICKVLTERFMASSRLPDMDQAAPSCTPSDPLPGTFLGLALDLRLERLYDLAPDIPDVMGLRALRPSAAIVKVMSVPDSRCIRVVTPEDHGDHGRGRVAVRGNE